MAPASSLLLLVVLSSSCLVPTSGRVVTEEDLDSDVDWPVLCPANTFYSLEEDECLTCSQCPINKIIISVCHGLQDTRCGPFYDFRDALPVESSDAVDDSQKDTKLSSNQYGKQATNSLPEIKDSFERSSNLHHTSSDNAVLSDSEWKSLTIALIVLVSVVFVLVIIFVIFFLRKTFMNKTKIVYEYSSPPENV